MQKNVKVVKGFYIPSKKMQEKDKLYKRLDEIWKKLIYKKKNGLTAQQIEDLRQEAGTIIVKIAEIDEGIFSENEDITKKKKGGKKDV